MRRGLFICGVAAIGAASFNGAEADGKIYGIPPDVKIPRKVCPDGYQMHGKMCTATEIFEPRLRCDLGSRMLDGQCVSTIVTDGEFVCPPDALMLGDECIVRDVENINLDCPKNFTIDPITGQCVRVSTQPAKTVCPEGYSVSHDGGCFAVDSQRAQVICPPGSEPNKKNKCVAIQVVPATPTCSPGMVQMGDICKSVIETQVETRCPHGTFTEGQACARETIQEGTPVCLSGDFDGKNCVLTAELPPIPVCRKDFTLQNGRCVRVLEDQPELVCTDGYHFESGVCRWYERVAPITQCPAETQLVRGDKCLERELLAPLESCKKGSTLVNGVCVEELTEDIKLVCPLEYDLADDGACVLVSSVESERACEHGDIRGKRCISYSRVGGEKVCPRGGVLPYPDASYCEEVSTTPASQTCPHGYTIEDSVCVKTRSVRGHVRCQVGEVSKFGKCELAVASAPLADCPKNAALTAEGCVRNDELEYMVQCDPEYSFVHGMCIPRVAKMHLPKELKQKKSIKDLKHDKVKMDAHKQKLRSQIDDLQSKKIAKKEKIHDHIEELQAQKDAKKMFDGNRDLKLKDLKAKMDKKHENKKLTLH